MPLVEVTPHRLAKADRKEAKKTKHGELVPSGRVHFRRTQMLSWSAIAGVLVAALIAGLYFLILQMHWHLDVAGIHWNGGSLKGWWDNLNPFHISNFEWGIYRHSAFRDILEPSAAVMGVMTLLAKPKYWEKQVSTFRLVISPFILLVLAIGMALAGTWLIDFSAPVSIRHFLDHGQIGNLALGFLIAKILHRFWAPVGATYQGKILQRSVLKSKRSDRIPSWVRRPLAPPVLRERFSKIYRGTSQVELAEVEPSRLHRLALTVMLSSATIVTVIGLIAHYWLGKGHTVPYLSS